MHVCPRCQSDRLVKNGSAAGKPKKQCKQCGRQFTRTTPRGKPLSMKITAVLWYLSGLSMNRIAFLLRVSAQAVLTWIRALAQHYQEKPEPIGRTIVLELDEMSHYLKNERPQTLDLESPGSRYGAAAGLGMWPAGQGSPEEDGGSPGTMGRAAVLHGQMGDLCVGHPTGQAGAE
jgi:transposase